jgi:hypothetical protein
LANVFSSLVLAEVEDFTFLEMDDLRPIEVNQRLWNKYFFNGDHFILPIFLNFQNFIRGSNQVNKGCVVVTAFMSTNLSNEYGDVS